MEKVYRYIFIIALTSIFWSIHKYWKNKIVYLRQLYVLYCLLAYTCRLWILCMHSAYTHNIMYIFSSELQTIVSLLYWRIQISWIEYKYINIYTIVFVSPTHLHIIQCLLCQIFLIGDDVIVVYSFSKTFQ